MDELLINVRNEAIVQTANLYILGRQALLAGIGLGALTLEAAQAYRSVPSSAVRSLKPIPRLMLARFREEGMAKASEAETGASSLTDRAAVALADSTSTILRALHLHSTDQ